MSTTDPDAVPGFLSLLNFRDCYETLNRGAGYTLATRYKTRYWWLHSGYTEHKAKGFATVFIVTNPLIIGAGEMNRTPDLLITNELLYRLSYTGFVKARL